MRYLFGDSSESSLETNYLEFLREVVDFGVLVLQAESGLSAEVERRNHHLHTVEEEARAVEQLGQRLQKVTGPLVVGNNPANRCAAAIAQLVTEVVTREATQARARIPAEIEGIDREIARWQRQCAVALRNLFGSSDVPNATPTVAVHWHGSAFEARLSQEVFGARATLILNIPDGGVFSKQLFVEQLAQDIGASEPVSSGGESAVEGHSKLRGHHVAAVIVDTAGVAVHLRLTHLETQPGRWTRTTRRSCLLSLARWRKRRRSSALMTSC
jgi:hypothetical protein